MRFSYVIGMISMGNPVGTPRHLAPPVESLYYLYAYAEDLVTDETRWTPRDLPRGTPSELLSMWTVLQESLLWEWGGPPPVFQYREGTPGV